MKRLNACGWLITLLLLGPAVAKGQDAIHLSPDISIPPTSSPGFVANDHSTILGTQSITTFNDIPLSADLIGYGEALAGHKFIVLDTTAAPLN